MSKYTVTYLRHYALDPCKRITVVVSTEELISLLYNGMVTMLSASINYGHLVSGEDL